MQLLSEFRNPTHWYSKLLAVLLAVAFFVLLAAGTIAGYLVFNIVVIRPPGGDAAVNLSIFPGHPEDVTYQVPGVGAREGWFFPGLKQAPTVVLCPGYHASRGELLPLATALQDHRYNVFLFDFDTDGAATGTSTLGYREVRELRAAISALAGRDDVDRSRFGLWGSNMGGYAALGVAETDPRIRALVVESVYDRPEELLRLLVVRGGLSSLPLLREFTEKDFLWLNYRNRNAPPLSARLSSLSGAAKLFLEAEDESGLIGSTHRLFNLSPPPKEEALLARGNYAGMLDDEKHDYENRLVSFFLVNLPPEMPVLPTRGRNP